MQARYLLLLSFSDSRQRPFPVAALPEVCIRVTKQLTACLAEVPTDRNSCSLCSSTHLLESQSCCVFSFGTVLVALVTMRRVLPVSAGTAVPLAVPAVFRSRLPSLPHTSCHCQGPRAINVRGCRGHHQRHQSSRSQIIKSSTGSAISNEELSETEV